MVLNFKKKFKFKIQYIHSNIEKKILNEFKKYQTYI